MTNENINVADNVVVSLAYVLSLDNGEEIDRAERTEPLEYIHGAGQIIPGLEKALVGSNTGDQMNVVLQPADGYGERNPQEVAEVDRKNFPSDLALSEGYPVSVTNRQSGEKMIAYISEIQSETVTLDFNHPLAGEVLHFSVEVLDLRYASKDELAHGHVHAPGADH